VPLAFDGSQTALRLVARTSFKDGPDGIPRWVDIRWVSGELLVEERRILPPDNTPDSMIYWSGSILRAKSCSFNYLIAAQPGRSVEWLREWHYPANSRLPRAVRLECVVTSANVVESILPLDYALSSAAGLTLR
jgi:hypothetical protein